MKALVFEKSGLENLAVKDVEKPAVGPTDVLVQVQVAGVNPIDISVVTSMPNVRPMPHIPGAEFAGVIDQTGDRVVSVKRGDRVTVYNRVFDGSCDMCLSNNEMLCRNGGIWSVITNGGYAEYAAVPERNAFKIPDDMTWELAASLPVSALTPYHALKAADLKPNENLAIFGASGNTGVFAVQLGKKFGAKVFAVSRKDWLKDFGADHVVSYDDAKEKIANLTAGKMADVVMNSLGAATWSTALDVLGLNARLVLFGVLTGGDVSLRLNRIYSRQTKIIGTTGGSRKELQDLIALSNELKLKVWTKFKLEDGTKALQAMSSKERDGRILIEIP